MVAECRDKQSACFHKALAPNNTFLNNVCFNTSRHAVNFQDGFGGGASRASSLCSVEELV